MKSTNYCFLRAILIVALQLSAVGCGYREQGKFDEARREGTADAMRTFLKEWPQGKHAQEATALLHELLYNEAKAKDTIEAYKFFFGREPCRQTRRRCLKTY